MTVMLFILQSLNLMFPCFSVFILCLVIGFQEAMSFLSILGTYSAQITVNYQFNKSN